MAFVFRGDKPAAVAKANPVVGPGTHQLRQALTTSRSTTKTKYPRPTSHSEAWNPNTKKTPTLSPPWSDPAPTTSTLSTTDKK